MSVAAVFSVCCIFSASGSVLGRHLISSILLSQSFALTNHLQWPCEYLPTQQIHVLTLLITARWEHFFYSEAYGVFSP